jgi:hypothetical protein
LYAEVCDDVEQEERSTVHSATIKRTYTSIREEEVFFMVKGFW